MIASLFKKEERTRFQGESCAFTAITEQDTKHLLNSIMLRHEGILPTSQLEQVFKFVIGIVTGRRACEIESIAASSWEIHFEIINGERRRTISFIFCYKKGQGFAEFPCTFMECIESSTEVNLVVIALVVLERKGMIKSALDVYNGTERLKIDEHMFINFQPFCSIVNIQC